jgi:hypothetical protein
MRQTLIVLATLLLLTLNGFVHGLWTQRWTGLTEAEVQAASDHLPKIPLKLGSWDGHRIEIAAATLPEEVVGRSIAVSYVHRVTGNMVIIYLACGRAQAMTLHTPTECYPDNGYKLVVPETRVSIPLEPAPDRPQFVTATFQSQSIVPVCVRVYWSWQADGGWVVPDNPGRSFRSAPFLYKCYAIRLLTTPDEPLKGDPCVDLLKELIPSLDQALARGQS